MYLEEELHRHLLTSTSPERDRNARLIAYYYGFGDIDWPTYEEVADYFGIGTKERVRQIIEREFILKLENMRLPSLEACAKQLQRNEFVSSSTFAEQLIDTAILDRDLKPRSLLKLLNDFSLCSDYDLVNGSFSQVSRLECRQGIQTYFIRRDHLPAVKRALHDAKTLPGRLGLAKFDDLRSELTKYGTVISSALQQVLRCTEHARFIQVNGVTWFAVEDRDNTIINRCEKVFSTVESCDVLTLSTALANSLRGRSHQFEYPGTDVVEAFIRNSRRFRVEGNTVKFVGERGSLSLVEADFHAFLIERGPVSFQDGEAFLLARGYSRPNILKTMTASPLVFVDKSGGRRQHRYSAIPSLQVANLQSDGDSSRYVKYSEQLSGLRGNTDADVIAIARREQQILKNWLFAGKEQESCAICGETFSVGALVTAHKKKRSECSEAERLDPYIVMPLCKLGCDYLYEEGIIVISNGLVKPGRFRQQHRAEYRRAQGLIGRTMEAQWLAGDPAWFESRIEFEVVEA